MYEQDALYTAAQARAKRVFPRVILVHDIADRAHWVNPCYVVSVDAPASGGAYYHLLVRGAERKPIILSQRAASAFLHSLLAGGEP